MSAQKIQTTKSRTNHFQNWSRALSSQFGTRGAYTHAP